MKTLIFEGAGWDVAKHNGVGNCRIRTRIENNEGRIIYLEMGGHEKSKYDKSALNFPGRVDHCFYCDRKEDKRNSYSAELVAMQSMKYEYTKQNIIEIVNEKLNCNFDAMYVDNRENAVRVHDTEKPLCSSKQND